MAARGYPQMLAHSTRPPPRPSGDQARDIGILDAVSGVAAPNRHIPYPTALATAWLSQTVARPRRRPRPGCALPCGPGCAGAPRLPVLDGKETPCRYGGEVASLRT
jgi:hypothetical protein